MATTRQTLAGLSHWQVIVWYSLAALSTAIFLAGVILLVRKYRAGRKGSSAGLGRLRVVPALRTVLAQTTIRGRDNAAGIAHALTFYGFLVLFIGTVILAIQNDIAAPLGWDFWHGAFYLGYSLFLDLFGAALTVGVLVFIGKRTRRPPRLDYRRVDNREDAYDRRRYVIGDWGLLAVLLFLSVSGFVLEALRIAETNPSFERWSPCGWSLAQLLRATGVSGTTAADAHLSLWWIHGAAALAFVAAIPFTKAVHMLVDPVSLATRDSFPGAHLAGLSSERELALPGYRTIDDLSPKHLLSLDSCTKCGNCHVVCPATAAGLPLSPRDLILDLREHAEASLGARHALHIPPTEDASKDLRDVIPSDTLWSCTQCMACVEVCPVGVEHVPIIVDLRRHRVDVGDLDPQLQSTLESIYESGNSFGMARRRRARWTDGLDFTPKDARAEPVDLLWFVGDYASLDPRNQQATRALASILHRAGVDFGLLYETEQNAGNDVRRVGEEALFVDLATANIDAISACSFRRILTSDPHTYNTLKNEYPDLGGSWPIVHHSELLLELIEDERVQPVRPLDTRVTYHDPCALGRANGMYEPPRLVLSAIGCELVEMPRNRANSFCCGGGGGRIWMAETSERKVPRPAEARIEEAVALGAIELFVVCCPKDVVMYEDAIKTSGHESAIRLAELSELVLSSLEAAPQAAVPLS